MKGYRFGDLEHMTKWLERTEWGRRVVREVLAGPHGAELYQEFVDRALQEPMRPTPTYVVVELHGDGWVQVYGERHVRAVIVQRPIAVTTSENRAQLSSLIDEWIGWNLKPYFRDVYWPSYCRAAGQCERISVRQLAKREAEREFDLLAVKALKGTNQ